MNQQVESATIKKGGAARQNSSQAGRDEATWTYFFGGSTVAGDEAWLQEIGNSHFLGCSFHNWNCSQQ